jgi:hypothetical protein
MRRSNRKTYCVLIFLILPFISALYTSYITADNPSQNTSHNSPITIKSQFEARFFTAMKTLGALGGGVIGFGIADIIMDRTARRSAIDIAINGPWLDRFICLACVGFGASAGGIGMRFLLSLLDPNNNTDTTDSTGS